MCEDYSLAMRALVLRDSFGLDNLYLEQRSEVMPARGEVRVRVRAASLNYRDLLMLRGEYDRRLPLPAVLGSDAAGEVVACGDGVTRFRVGDLVCPIFARGWHEGPLDRTTPLRGLGGRVDGVFTESFVARAVDLVKAPEHLDAVQASTLGAAGVTAYRALFEHGVGPGRTVVVIGTGGVSLFAVSLAVAAGARVIVVSRSLTKVARALALGATDGIDSTATPAWGHAVRKLTQDVGADIVVEVGGAGTLAESINAVRPGGTIALIGTVATGGEAPSMVPVVMREIRIQGLLVGSRAIYEQFFAHAAATQLTPIVDRVYPIEEFRAAFEYFESGNHFGKVCLSF
jgi:NADPH:quinone reductase-like Zn-dependent oxidoreductase